MKYYRNFQRPDENSITNRGSAMRNVEIMRFCSLLPLSLSLFVLSLFFFLPLMELNLFTHNDNLPRSRRTRHAMLQPYRNITPQAPKFFVHFFVWSHRSTGCLHVSNQRRVRASRNGQYFSRGSIFLRAVYIPHSFLLPSVSLSLSISWYVSTWWYATEPASRSYAFRSV